MTLSAAFVLEGVPLVVSDLLITYLDPGAEESDDLFLPTSGPSREIGIDRPKVADLAQKIAIISDRLVVAYAGDPFMASRILRSLFRLKSDGAITWPKLLRFRNDRPHGLRIRRSSVFI